VRNHTQCSAFSTWRRGPTPQCLPLSPQGSRQPTFFCTSVMHKKRALKVEGPDRPRRVLAVPSDQHPKSVRPICGLFV